jgi:hypothetical protein
MLLRILGMNIDMERGRVSNLFNDKGLIYRGIIPQQSFVGVDKTFKIF